MPRGTVNVFAMDMDDHSPVRAGDPLAAVIAQDLDPLSVAELEARVASLEAEIARCRERIERAASHRSSADALFR